MNKAMYKPFKIGGMEIKNRLVASAMFEYAADNGKITGRVVNRYRELAEGGFGLIITGMQAVTASGAVAPIMVNTEYDGFIDDLRDVADVVHNSGAKIVVQLQHAGGKTFPAEGYDKFDVSENSSCHAATTEELDKVIKNFGVAALRCKDAGVDGVQIHAAHGFLINAFLSPSTNHRTDNYGGVIENRARLLFQIYNSIREAVGKDFCVGVKFPFSDLIENSITPEESLFALKKLEDNGLDFAEITSGMVMDGSKNSFTPHIGKNEAPFLNMAKTAAENLNIPIISVCGYRTPQFINEVLATTKIAAISFGRATVREPNLPLKWQTSDTKATCISCNKCCDSVSDGIITCQVAKKIAAKATN